MEAVMAGDLGIGPGYPPRIMGVLNVSAESPYDPSVFTEASAAARYIEERLVAEGADIVDIGLSTANKRFEVLTAEEELERLETAVEAIDGVKSEVVFSIETRYAEVAEAALKGGFDMVNDVCGFADPEMAGLCEHRDVPVVKMAGPGDIDRPGALSSVDDIYDALASDPLPRTTIIDPAFGGWSESKDLAVDRETFRRLREFTAIDRPLLVSINRKNFLRRLADRSTDEALPVSLAATSLAVERGADVIRTHDVSETRDAAIIGDAFRQEPLRDPELGIRELEVRTRRELHRHVARIGGPKEGHVEGVLHTFEFTKASTEVLEMLRPHADAVGVDVYAGTDEAVAILVGSANEFANLAARIDGEPEILDALELIVETTL